MVRRRLVVGCLAALVCFTATAWATASAVDAQLQASVLDTAAPSELGGDNFSDATPAPPSAYDGLVGLAGAPALDTSKQLRLAEFHAENEWKNSLVMWILPDSWREAMPHWTQVRFFFC